MSKIEKARQKQLVLIKYLLKIKIYQNKKKK
jgi:hypothetical protein